MVAVTSSRSKIALSCLLFFCAALFLSAYSARNPAISQWGVVLVSESLRPVQMLLKGTAGGVGSFWDNYIALVGLRQEYDELKEKFRALEVENSRLLEWEGEIKRLRHLLGIAQDQGLVGIAVDVIGYDPSNWTQMITVDRGTKDGIERGMPVIQGDAVVGQVVAVAPHSAKVLLITDSTSGVDSIIQSGRARGVVEGDGHNLCQLRYVSQEDEITIGDRIITSGMDGVYPKGVMVGVVADIKKSGRGMFQSIIVKPAVNFARLETVLVVTNAPRVDEELRQVVPAMKKAP